MKLECRKRKVPQLGSFIWSVFKMATRAHHMLPLVWSPVTAKCLTAEKEMSWIEEKNESQKWDNIVKRSNDQTFYFTLFRLTATSNWKPSPASTRRPPWTGVQRSCRQVDPGTGENQPDRDDCQPHLITIVHVRKSRVFGNSKIIFTKIFFQMTLVKVL